MAAPVAVPAGLGIGLTIGLWALVGLLVAMGLKAGWDHSIGVVLRGLGNAADVGVWKIKIKGGAGFRKLDRVVQEELGKFILLNERALGLWWHGTKQVVSYTGDSLADFGRDTFSTIENLVDGVIPFHVGAATKPLAGRVGQVAKAGEARDSGEARARVRADKAQAADLDNTFGRARGGIDNVGAKARSYTDAQVGRVQGQIAAERTYSHRILNKRLTWLEKALGVGALGGIALATLTRVFPYWQCSGFRRFARGVCRSPLGSLDWLFGLAGLAIVALDVEQIAEWGQDLADELGGLFDRMTE